MTKYRKKILGDLHLARLDEIFAELAADFDANLIECDGEADHIRLLLETSPKTPAISKIVNSFKAVSSRRMRREFADIAGAYVKPVLWSRSYFAGTCGGAPLGSHYEVRAESTRLTPRSNSPCAYVSTGTLCRFDRYWKELSLLCYDNQEEKILFLMNVVK